MLSKTAVRHCIIVDKQRNCQINASLRFVFPMIHCKAGIQ